MYCLPLRAESRFSLTKKLFKEVQMTDIIEESGLDPEELEAILISESIQLEAIINILEKKGILTREDIENEIAAIQVTLDNME
jgi:hypothetical protein